MSRHHKKHPKKKSNTRDKQKQQCLIKQKSTQHTNLQNKLQIDSKDILNENIVQQSKLKKCHVPYHLIKYSQIIEQQRLGLKEQIKKIKKIFLDANHNAERLSIKLRRSNFYPTILIQYKQSTNVGKQYIFLRDLIREQKDLFLEHKDKIDGLYTLYEIVPRNFYQLVIFGILRAKQLKIRLNYKKTSEVDYNIDLYYCWDRNKKDINFTLIDRKLTIIDFIGNNIYNYTDHDKQIKIYKEFLSFLRNQNHHILQQSENQQNYIQQNHHYEQQQSNQELKSKLLDYLDKDFSQKINQYKQKEENILNMWNQYNTFNDRAYINKIQQELNCIRIGLQNYQNIALEIRNYNIQKMGNFMIKNSLKRLKLAEKQISSKLPIITKKQEIFALLKTQSIILIEGQTGSGKSTQLPQLLCQYFKLFQSQDSKPILVSQPRRLATRTLAERVASEMNQKVGYFVDYKNSVNRSVNPRAKIIFKLDRMILDQFTEDRELSSYSCLVIDQAHERTVSIDVIISLVKDLIKIRPNFKVIITSASMDVELFERYFGGIEALKVSGRIFDVDIRYRNYQGISTIQKIKKVFQQQILSGNTCLANSFSGHILTFCHSINEINELTKYYSQYLNSNRFQVYALHGKITPEEQRRAFVQTHKHKLIFASRIAQTAITIDDVRVVIDTGEDYQVVYDQRYKFSSMKLRLISQSSAKQRAGRSGRTAPGFCYRLYSQQDYKSRPFGKVPEIQNSSLDAVVLRLKSLGISDVKSFSYISPPKQEAIDASLQSLKIIEALNKDQSITALGQILLIIPIQPMLGRSIIESLFIQKVLENSKWIQDNMQISLQEKQKIDRYSIKKSVISILCLIINSFNLFLIPSDQRDQSDFHKFNNLPINEGDFFLLKALYDEYKEIYEALGDRSQLKYWYSYFFLNRKVLKQVLELETQLNSLLNSIQLDFNLLQDELNDVQYKLRYCKNYNDILMLSLISSFIPNLSRYSGNPQIGYTLISQNRPIKIYGTSSLALFGLTEKSPEWILAYDLYTNEKGKSYCKIAQQIKIDFLQNIIGNYAWKKYKIAEAKKQNPYYRILLQITLPTKFYQQIKRQYLYYERKSIETLIYKNSIVLFDDQKRLLKLFEIIISKKEIDLKIKSNYENHLMQKQKKIKSQGYCHYYLANTRVYFNNKFLITNVERVFQTDFLIYDLQPKQAKIIGDLLQGYDGIVYFKTKSTFRIRFEDEQARKYIQNKIEELIENSLSNKSFRLKKVPRNQRKVSQTKVLIKLKVKSLLQQSKQKDVSKYYKLLRQAIHGQKKQNRQLKFKTISEWRQIIENLLSKVNIKPEQCAINIFKNQLNQNKNRYSEILAEISNLDGGIYEKLNSIQNIEQYLGCQKIYIRQYIQQILAFISEKVFCSLKEEYLDLISSIKSKYKGLIVIDKSIKLGNNIKVKIIGKGYNRQVLWETNNKINELFKQRQLQFTQSQSYFLDFIDRHAILQKLQGQFNYKIVFEVKSKKLFIYCDSNIFQKVQLRLRECLQNADLLTKQISFKNRSVAEMVDKINARCDFFVDNTQKKSFIKYQILFTKRILLLTTTQQEHQILQKQFDKTNMLIKKDCDICYSKIFHSYQLLNCLHEFCKGCLLGYIQQSIQVYNESLFCPNSDCNKQISIFDIQTILSENIFKKICDEKTINFIKEQLKYALCSRCQNVIWKDDQEQQKLQACRFCGLLAYQ